jgi:hypothetical protein
MSLMFKLQPKKLPLEETGRVTKAPAGQVCTWEGCEEPACKSLMDDNWEPWAHLCSEHYFLTEGRLQSTNPREVLSVWIRAQGGAKKSSDRCLNHLRH